MNGLSIKVIALPSEGNFVRIFTELYGKQHHLQILVFFKFDKMYPGICFQGCGMADLCTVCTRPLVVVSEMACDCENGVEMIVQRFLFEDQKTEV